MVIKKWSKVINNSNFVYMNIKRIVILVIINIDKKIGIVNMSVCY